MALTIYEQVNASVGFSTDSTSVNAMRHSIDGRTGGTIERLYYVRNDDPAISYGDIKVRPVSNPAKNIVSGTNGYSVKFRVGASQPTEQEWATITPANQITLTDILDTVTYLPFWVRIDVPRGAPIDTITNTVFRITAVEGVV